MINRLILALAAATAAAVEDAPNPSKLQTRVGREPRMQPRRKANGWTLFHLDKQPFVQVFADCLKDPGCSIQYLHRGKTGGTFVESQMFTMLGTKNEASCCQRPVVERFLKNRDYKCTLPFIAYQVKTAAFRDVILKECQKVFARKAQSSGARQRMVVLVTYRAVWKSTSVSGARQFFTKSFLGDDAAVLARSSGGEFTPQRRRAGVASMAWRTTR